jgi:hypothetical protein
MNRAAQRIPPPMARAIVQPLHDRSRQPENSDCHRQQMKIGFAAKAISFANRQVNTAKVASVMEMKTT